MKKKKTAKKDDQLKGSSRHPKIMGLDAACSKKNGTLITCVCVCVRRLFSVSSILGLLRLGLIRSCRALVTTTFLMFVMLSNMMMMMMIVMCMCVRMFVPNFGPVLDPLWSCSYSHFLISNHCRSSWLTLPIRLPRPVISVSIRSSNFGSGAADQTCVSPAHENPLIMGTII